MNKLGDERVLSLYWFVMFVIITIGVVSGVLIFFSNMIDVREAEAGILADRVIDCFVDEGRLNSKFGIVNEENFESECGFVFSDGAYDYGDEGQYFVEVSFDGSSILYNSKSESRFKGVCFEDDSTKRIPICVQRRLMVLDSNGEFVLLYVLAGIDKVQQNAL